MIRKFVKAGVFWGFPGSLSSVQSLSRVQLFATPWATNLSGNHPANAGDFRDTSLILRLGRSSGVGNGNPLQYSCLGNPMDWGEWQATVHGVAKSQARLSNWTTTCVIIFSQYFKLLSKVIKLHTSQHTAGILRDSHLQTLRHNFMLIWYVWTYNVLIYNANIPF